MRNIKTIFILIVLIFGIGVPQILKGQNIAHCGTDEYYARQQKIHPEIKVLQRKMDAQFENSQPLAKKNDEDTETYTVPVVFHVIHANGPEKISKAVIRQQMITLNEAYNKRNADTMAVRHIFKDLISNAHIRFVLATKDPWGNCTSGIDYIASPQTYNATNNAKYLSWWDNSHYLNVWVVNSINQPAGLQGVLAGYAQFPWQAVSDASTDGVMVAYNYIGKNQKTLVHEIGHYLGLYHPFQDGCSEDQALQGDHVRDTPPEAVAAFGYNTSANTCHTDVPDLPDMIENYMDYASHKYMFTSDQVLRMRWFIRGARSELISSKNLQNTIYDCSATAIQEVHGSINNFKVYPNPTSSTLSIDLTLQKTSDCHIEITDLMGRMVYAADHTFMSGGDVLLLNPDRFNIPAALYILKISTPRQDFEKKIFLEK